MRVILLAAFGFGCGAQLGGDGTGQTGTDGGSGGGSDASTLPIDGSTTGACANGRQVYLNFDGVAVTRGSPSDATQNRVSWMTNASGTVPRYRDGDGNRLTYIQTITAGVKARLSGTPITVVTTRPTTGPYVMIVYGGDQNDIGTIYSFATNEHDCGDAVKSDVGWISDLPNVSYVQDLTIGAIGWGLGLNGTNDPNDCMCAWANSCDSAPGACTLSASIASTTSQAPATTCPNQNPQNEVAAFSTGFCQ